MDWERSATHSTQKVVDDILRGKLRVVHVGFHETVNGPSVDFVLRNDGSLDGPTITGSIGEEQVPKLTLLLDTREICGLEMNKNCISVTEEICQQVLFFPAFLSFAC